MWFLSSRLVRLAVPMLVVMLSVVVSAGCGGSGDSGSATTQGAQPTSTVAPASSTTTAAAPSTTAPAATSTSATSAAPSGEIGATVSVASKNGGYPTENLPDWSQIKSVLAFRNPEYGDTAVWVCLATYEITANSLSDYWALSSPAAGQGSVELVLTRTVADTNEPPLVVGRYDCDAAQGTAELTGSAKILVQDGVGIQFVQGTGQNYVEVTAISDTEISGTFSVADKWTQISGSFTAPLK